MSISDKDHTLAMLAHYAKEIAYGRMDHNILLIHAKGAASWAGMDYGQRIAFLTAELERTRMIFNASNSLSG